MIFTPLIIIREFWKFIKQMIGRENMFGYRSTAANQLFLLYCLSGKIYFTDKVHPITKYFWLILNVSGLSTAYAIALAYFLYDTRQELVMRLTILYAVGTSTNIVLVFPILSYRNRRGIEAAIRVLDDVLQHSESSPVTEGKINLKTMLAYNCCVTLAMNCVYGVVPYLDAMIFYQDEKVKNAMYYTLPLPNIHEYGSASLFSASAALISSFYSLFALEWIAMINFILFWGVSCHNEMVVVRHRLGTNMDLWSARYEERFESSNRLEVKFRSILKRNMDTFNRIARAIEHYRQFVELFCSMAIPVIYLIQVVQLYTVISMDMPFTIRLKGISFFVTAGWPMFLMYWTGQILENGTSTVSFSVYETPWYQTHTIETRKQVIDSVLPFESTCKMIQLLREFWRIAKQMRGKENMFGYRTTTANQLYLLCCFCGKFYFSDKIHPQMKYFWFLINFSGLMTAFAILLGYFLYDTRQDYVLQLTVINAVSTCVNLVVTFPIVLYYHQSGVESMIRGVDAILEHKSRTRSQKRNIRISVKWMLVCNSLVVFAMSVIYGFAPFLDVMIFYEDQKLKDPVYYILPLPNVHEYGSMEWFLASALVISMYYSLFSLEWLAMTNFIIFWGITCYNEMLLLHDRLNSQMRRLCGEMVRGHEMPANWKMEFDNILRKHVNDYKRITRVIKDFRGFVELFCTTAILVNFFIQVVQPYVIISTDMIFCVRLKGIAYQVIAGWPMFLMYWTGQIIENGISAVSFSVYSVPWYWSVEVRQDTYIFLCRTQRTESVVMLKVYPLVLRNYSRLAHAVLSSVNILRTLALKVKNP